MFTKHQSIEGILKEPGMKPYLEVFFQKWLLELFPEEFVRAPLGLAEQRGKTPWGEPLSVIGDQLLDGANLCGELLRKERRALLLWDENKGDWSPETERRADSGVRPGKEGVFLVTPSVRGRRDEGTETAGKTEEGLSDRELRPAAIVCPGGGYGQVCFEGEGTPVLSMLEEAGYRTFLLRYETNAPYPEPQMDLALGILYLRSHWKEYGIHPGQLIAVGASAGGHLCALEAAEHEKQKDLVLSRLSGEERRTLGEWGARPDGLCLSYPVISFEEETHEDSARILTGGRRELRAGLSVNRLAGPDYPPSFIWACRDDDCVPCSNVERMARALEDAGAIVELHIYPSGGHGCGLAYTKEAWPWSGRMLKFMERYVLGKES